MRYLFLSLLLTCLLWTPSKAQEDFEYVFEYINYYEAFSGDLGAVYTRFRTKFGSSTVEVQQARIDSITAEADELWKNHIKSMPGYKGDNTYADGYKELMKYIRGDFKKKLQAKKSELFQAPAGTDYDGLTENQKAVFDYYKELITEYSNKVEIYKATKKVLENNFADEANSYVFTRILEVVELNDAGNLNAETAKSLEIYQKKGTFYEMEEYTYVSFNFSTTTDKQQLYNDFVFLKEKMSLAPDEYRYYENTYMYGGQDAYLTVNDNPCETVLSLSCDDPWVAHLSFYEGLYGGSPSCMLSVRFEKERTSDSED